MTGLTIPTPHGTAEVELRWGQAAAPRWAQAAAPRWGQAAAPRGYPHAIAAVLLGHGAGGSTGAPDLVAVTNAATGIGIHVALVTQPYQVAGRRAPAPARQLDQAWLAVAAHLAKGVFAGLPIVFGGRSSGARVACRTAAAGAAVAVLCLAFPMHPPGCPERSRIQELEGVEVPVLVVQGQRDPFGHPQPATGREVVLLPGDHSLKADPGAVGSAVAQWLQRRLADGGAQS